MHGIFVIFLFYALGIFLSRLTGEFLPGSILGMILLFLALLSGVVKNDGLKPVASVITRNMALFFVPVGVGVIESGRCHQWTEHRIDGIGYCHFYAFTTPDTMK